MCAIMNVYEWTFPHRSGYVFAFHSILWLTNQENTPAVIQRAMEKHDLGSGSAEHYELVQIISEDKELVIPPKANVFYAMNTQANLDFTLRRKVQPWRRCKGGAWAAQHPPDLQAGGAGGSAGSHGPSDPIEVEVKFAVGPKVEAALAALLAGGLPHTLPHMLPPSPPFRDCYFDGPGAPLGLRDVWLRHRQGQGWQLKLPHNDPHGTGNDPQVSNSNPQMAEIDPRVAGSTPQVSNSNLEVTGSDLQVTEGDLEVTHSDPQVGESGPHVTDSDLPVAESDAQVTQSGLHVINEDAQVTCSDPQLPNSNWCWGQSPSTASPAN
ncbi:hypothetical protein AV530_011591 [Patagioenas fasciata monilis]|uniref:Ras-associating domain-containing protein n=1 Tax=Patagioenas fasciata monilis TaxID=372326 RepID=A0A1V4KNG7_PATFA|nr:hypothetical protein AV530_011591 [Patagioenas fasciata monilis]